MVHDRRSGLSSYVSGLLSAGRTVFTAKEAERVPWCRRAPGPIRRRAARHDVEPHPQPRAGAGRRGHSVRRRHRVRWDRVPGCNRQPEAPLLTFGPPDPVGVGPERNALDGPWPSAPEADSFFRNLSIVSPMQMTSRMGPGTRVGAHRAGSGASAAFLEGGGSPPAKPGQALGSHGGSAPRATAASLTSAGETGAVIHFRLRDYRLSL